MKLKFAPSLEYQQDAVNAVVRAFEGQPFVQTGAMAFQSLQIGGLFQTELGMGNRLILPEEDILKNVQAIQEANDIEKVAALQGRDFSIEMETGTGKTYVYLRTIFELNKLCGFKKFIIVVPSVAIREGVLKSIDVTKEHFQTLYLRRKLSTVFSWCAIPGRVCLRLRQNDGKHGAAAVIQLRRPLYPGEFRGRPVGLFRKY